MAKTAQFWFGGILLIAARLKNKCKTIHHSKTQNTRVCSINLHPAAFCFSEIDSL